MSEFPDPDFSFLRSGVIERARDLGRNMEGLQQQITAGAQRVDGLAKGASITHGVSQLHAAAATAGKAAQAHYAVADGLDQARKLAEQWESAAPRDAEIDAADNKVKEAEEALIAAANGDNYAMEVAAADALHAAQQSAAVLRSTRIAADTAFRTGSATVTAKSVQRAADVDRGTGSGVRLPGSLRGAFEEIRSPAPAPAPRTPSAPAAPRTPAGAPPAAPVRPAAASPGKAEMPPMPQVPQQAQQQPQTGGAPAGAGALPSAAGGRPTDKKRDSDSTPTGLAGAVGATGAGASPLHPTAAAARPATAGYSRGDMTTNTNVTGRPSPQVNLSGGMPSTAPAQAAGTSAAPGGMGAPMAPMGGGMGGAGKGAGREVPRIVRAAEPYDDGIVPGGTILRGDAPPEQKAS